MPKRTKPIVALDIGTSKISAVIAERGDEVKILGCGSSVSKGVRKGVIINIESTVTAIKEALSQAEAMAGVKVKNCLASISGSHLEGLNSHGVVAVKSGEVTRDDVDRVVDAAKAVAIPLDREVLHVIPQEFIIDNQDGIREPVGISGVRLEAKVHVVTGAISSSQNIIKCASRSGLDTDAIVASSLAASESVVTPEEIELGVCVMDIGGGSTDIVVHHNGAVKLTAVMPVGGSHITADIAAGLRTPVASAEEIKLKYGTCLVRSRADDELFEVPSTGGRDERKYSRRDLADIIQPRVNEIFSAIYGFLKAQGSEVFLSSGIVLTGGTALLHGILPLAEETFRLPVRIGSPGMKVAGLSDLVQSPEFSTAVGLLIRDNGVVEKRTVFGGFGKVANWFKEHF